MDSQQSLLENYDLFVKWLYGRLQQDLKLLQAYDRVIREQLRDGIVEVTETLEPPDKSALLTSSPSRKEG